MKTKVVFYGDDFTGATDNCAQFHRHGLRTVLYFENPGLETLRESAESYDVIGIAGTARSLATSEMSAELAPIFDDLKEVGAALMQYKCCSTFDSSEETGSLGEAVRLMRDCWGNTFIPILAAMPEFGRYTIFGDHFARYGDHIYRLDRHPSMSHHPITPMREASLSGILESQGFTVNRFVDLRELDAHTGKPNELARKLINENAAVFDSYSEKQLVTAAGSIWRLSKARSVTALAAQGFAYGLGDYLRQSGEIATPVPKHRLAPVDKVLALSGSCSPLSAAQISWAEHHGYGSLRIPIEALVSPGGEAMCRLERDIFACLSDGRSVIAYTARGPDDPAIAKIHTSLGLQKLQASALAKTIGGVFARLIRSAVERTGVVRVVVAGGDSSSFSMRQLGAKALEIDASHFGHNAHVARLIAADRSINGLQVLLKGGQVGGENLYGSMLDGF